MIKSFLIDDEVHCLDTLNILLSDYCPEILVTGKYTSCKNALSAINELKPELVFLDIEMPYMNGFELLEQFREIPFSVIFTTSYDKYAIKAIKFSALDYLLKPIEAKELIIAVQKVEKQKMRPSPEQFQMLMNQIQHKDTSFAKIAVPTAEGFELIPTNQLVRCEAFDNYTHLFLTNKKRIIACRSLREMEEQLANFSSFVRVHNSFLINLNEVTKYIRGEGGYLIMSDESTVNVSRSRKDALLKFF
ncbi:MAG TPA: LytTR family DNA-binding domain-containing protein [Puia sp.]|nr:LytTR family DNA-binding domain-containing protein [Puia sp.]